MSDYNTDLYTWMQAQAIPLHFKNWSVLDSKNFAKETDSLERSDQRARKQTTSRSQ